MKLFLEVVVNAELLHCIHERKEQPFEQVMGSPKVDVAPCACRGHPL